jgi:hypothetical protein
MKNNFFSSIKPKIGVLALFFIFCGLFSQTAMGQTRYLTANNANWSVATGAWKLADLTTDTTIPATSVNIADHNRIQSNVLTSTVDGTYYQRLLTTSPDAGAGDMKFAGTGRLFLDTFSDQFYSFGGTVIQHQTTSTPTRLTIDCDVEISNSYTTTSSNRNSVIRVSGVAGNVIEFSSLSDLFLNGVGPTVSWPQSGTVEFNGNISGTRGLTCAPGTTIFGSTSNNAGLNVTTNSIGVVGGATVTVNTAANGTFFKNTSGANARINMSGALGTSSYLTINNANVWNSPININTLSLNRETGANLTINANQTTGTARTLQLGSATSVLNLTVASGVTMNFAASNLLAWTAGSYLNIYGFDGATINFGTTSAGLTAAQLGQIVIRDGVNAGKAVELDASGKLIIKTATNTWLGLTKVYNTATNWSNGTVPTALENVVIPVTANNPEMASNGNAYSLTIDSGASLTITYSFFMQVTGKIYNSGTINVYGGASLLQGSNIANANTGVYNVFRTSLALKRLDYTLWSSPVSGSQTLAGFSPNTSQIPSRFYTYNATGYTTIASPSTTTFTPATGYLIRMPNTDVKVDYDAGGATLAWLGTFTGIANNGVYTLTGLTPDTFYAVGNPYPSGMNTTTFLNGNTTGGTLYFWRKTNAVANSTGSAYASYTTAGGTAAGNSAPNDGVPASVIFAGQGFIVKTGPTSSTLTFSNNMRSANVALPKFFKTKKEATPDRVWLNLTSTKGVFSQALVAYIDGSTLGFDNGFDGEYINDSPIALTSNIDNKEYTIQGRPAFDATDVVALNFKTNVAGDYSIALDHFDGVFATGQDVYLVDSKTGIETDLKAGSYTFNAAAGTDNTRFSLKYQKTLKVDAPAFNDNSVKVYKNNGSVYVNSSLVAINTIEVYDIQGKLLASQRNVKANTASINNLKAINQVLIVKISSENNSVVSKKILN